MTAGGDQDPRELRPAEPVTEPATDPRPGIALPGTGLPTPLLIMLGVVLALALFLFLDAQRRARRDALDGQTHVSAQTPPPPPPLDVPPPPPPPTPVVIYQTRPAPIAMAPRSMPEPMPQQPMPQPMPPMAEPPFMPPQPRPAPAGGPGPALVVDLTTGAGASVNGAEGGVPGQSDADDTVRATLIRNRASVIPQGTIIAAVLETPLNSDRPGLARAIVSHDARGFDGARVLVPRGSRLFGEFRADPSPGMSRILITWTRLIRADGVAIKIGSPASDPLGGSGIPGKVNSHFLAHFASAVLQSALAVGVNLASQKSSSGSGSTVYLGLPSQSATAGQSLIPNVNQAPTVKVREGAEIAVMVAHDLDFAGTPLVRQ